MQDVSSAAFLQLVHWTARLPMHAHGCALIMSTSSGKQAQQPQQPRCPPPKQQAVQPYNSRHTALDPNLHMLHHPSTTSWQPHLRLTYCVTLRGRTFEATCSCTEEHALDVSWWINQM
jgi:hypothetical protein